MADYGFRSSVAPSRFSPASAPLPGPHAAFPPDYKYPLSLPSPLSIFPLSFQLPFRSLFCSTRCAPLFSPSPPPFLPCCLVGFTERPIRMSGGHSTSVSLPGDQRSILFLAACPPLLAVLRVPRDSCTAQNKQGEILLAGQRSRLGAQPPLALRCSGRPFCKPISLRQFVPLGS